MVNGGSEAVGDHLKQLHRQFRPVGFHLLANQETATESTKRRDFNSGL